MPNYCFGSINVTGPVEKVKEFDNKFKEKHTIYEQLFVMNPEEADKLEELKKTVDPSDIIMSKDNKEAYVKKEREDYSFNNFLPIPKEEAANWYDWHCNNWGTKWDVMEIDANLENIESGDISYTFSTAWSPCSKVVSAMSKAFPELEFQYSYEEDGMCFAGIETYVAGEITENLESDDSVEDGYRKFKAEHFDQAYYKCADCGHLIDECEYDDEHCCPECESLNILDFDHETYLQKEEV